MALFVMMDYDDDDDSDAERSNIGEVSHIGEGRETVCMMREKSIGRVMRSRRAIMAQFSSVSSFTSRDIREWPYKFWLGRGLFNTCYLLLKGLLPIK